MSIENSSFFAGVEALREKVGENELTGSVTVNQHYALEQHENMQYEHPRGGKAKYLSDPLLRSWPKYMTWIRPSVLRGSLTAAMAESMEDLSSQLDPEAPIDEDPNFIRLRRSGHPQVQSDGETVYDRPPVDPREPMMAPDDQARAEHYESISMPSF